MIFCSFISIFAFLAAADRLSPKPILHLAYVVRTHHLNLQQNRTTFKYGFIQLQAGFRIISSFLIPSKILFSFYTKSHFPPSQVSSMMVKLLIDLIFHPVEQKEITNFASLLNNYLTLWALIIIKKSDCLTVSKAGPLKHKNMPS